ncbi:Nicotianamine synthase protein [Methanophagales archaeon]|nr:Nicotianamine synthase protein [Methanophagales archaeon]
MAAIHKNGRLSNSMCYYAVESVTEEIMEIYSVIRSIFAYIPNYLQLAKTEYQGSPLKPGDNVLFLGSGPLPISLIILCRLYGLRGVGIEQEPDRAELSRIVLQKLGCSDQIRIIEGNQYTLPMIEKFELIMVAAQAEPKKAIFDHLADVLQFCFYLALQEQHLREHCLLMIAAGQILRGYKMQ